MDDRLKYLGGSDAAAVLGMSRWKTPLQVWGEKTGKIPAEDISDKLAVKLGNRLESVVAELFEEETGKKVARRNDTIYHAKYQFIGANIDRRVVGEDAILEVKTASGWKAREWEGDEIPAEYIAQCHHYLAVTGAAACYIAVLIGGNEKFVWKKIDRDEKIINAMIAKEVYFWNTFVVTGVQPDIITYRDATVLQALYPDTDNEAAPIQLGDEANQIVESIRAMEQDEAALGKQIDTEKNRLRAMLQSSAIGETGLYRITWKEQASERIDAKKLRAEAPEVAEKYTATTKTRVLRIADAKREG